jgi:hypothetical protein
LNDKPNGVVCEEILKATTDELYESDLGEEDIACRRCWTKAYERYKEAK